MCKHRITVLPATDSLSASASYTCIFFPSTELHSPLAGTHFPYPISAGSSDLRIAQSLAQRFTDQKLIMPA